MRFDENRITVVIHSVLLFAVLKRERERESE